MQRSTKQVTDIQRVLTNFSTLFEVNYLSNLPSCTLYSYDRENFILVESARKGRDQSRYAKRDQCVHVENVNQGEQRAERVHEVGFELTSVARECSGIKAFTLLVCQTSPKYK
jgi:hypothetical protein